MKRKMGRQRLAGFTIIEVVLVIAVSGLLMLGIMDSSLRQVNEQNYRDGVEVFKDFLAGQFEDIESVKNNRDNGCGSVTSVDRGMGECFYSGKLIHIKAAPGSETEVVSYPVKSTMTDAGVGTPAAIGSVEALTSVNENVVSSKIPWGIQARTPEPASVVIDNLYILVFRSPITGNASTVFYTSSVGTSHLTNMVKAGMSVPVEAGVRGGDQIICLSDANGIPHERWLAIKIASGVPNASSLTNIGSGQC